MLFTLAIMLHTSHRAAPTPLVLAVGLCLLTSPAVAHVVSFEPQALEPNPFVAPPAADYSLESPRQLDNIWGSKAIFCALDPDDLDYFEFTLATDEAGSLLSALALTPACEETRDNYVSVALIGPGLPAPDPGVSLPFTVPDGLGVLVRMNPEVPPDETRPVFYEPTSRSASYLPLGATNACIWETPWACDWSNALAVTLDSPGTYTIVAWDTDGLAQDYSLSVGFVDQGYYYVSEEEPLTYDQAWLHGPCTSAPLPPDAIAGAAGAAGTAGSTGQPVRPDPSLAGAGGATPTPSASPDESQDSGCSCSLPARSTRRKLHALLSLTLLLAACARRRKLPRR